MGGPTHLSAATMHVTGAVTRQHFRFVPGPLRSPMASGAATQAVEGGWRAACSQPWGRRRTGGSRSGGACSWSAEAIGVLPAAREPATALRPPCPCEGREQPGVGPASELEDEAG